LTQRRHPWKKGGKDRGTRIRTALATHDAQKLLVWKGGGKIMEREKNGLSVKV